MKQLTIKDAVVYVPLRMSVTMRNRVASLADANDMSLNRQLVELIEDGLRANENL